MSGPATRCGFVAVIGAPNAGKSTLVNRLVGQKVSIVSPKAQTTRMRLSGIAMRGPAQIVFVDTPGIFRGGRRRLERAMVKAAWRALGDADRVVLVVDAARRHDADTDEIVAGLKAAGTKAILALNKVDLVDKPRLLRLAERLHATGIFSDVFMVSAETGDGVEDIARHLAKDLPEGPWLYPEDQLSDLPQRLVAAEITREKLFYRLRDELPYAAAVVTEGWEPFADGSVRITQIILVERDNHRPIVLGREGRMIKAIGTAARKEIAAMLGQRVHLSLRVKVRPGWADEKGMLGALGVDGAAGR